MAVLAYTGAETGTLNELLNPSGVSVVSDPLRTGRYAYRFSPSGTARLVFNPTGDSVYFRGYGHLSALPTPTRANIMQFRSAADANIAALGIEPDGRVSVNTASTGTVFSQDRITINEWYRYEIAASNWYSYIHLRVQGVYQFDFSLTLGADIGGVRLLWAGSAGFFTWDDVHITTDGWPGPGYVIARQGKHIATPTYNGQWFRSSDLPIQECWSTTPPDDPNAAQSGAAPAEAQQVQTMVVESPSQPSSMWANGAPAIHDNDRLLACRVAIYANRTTVDAPDHYIARILAGTLNLESVTTTTTYNLYQGSMFLPASTKQLDTCEIGGAKRGPGTAEMRIADAWLHMSVQEGQQGIRYFTGFESGDGADLMDSSGPIGIAPDYARSGGYGMGMFGADAVTYLGPDVYGYTHTRWDLPTVYVKCHIRPFPGTGAQAFLRLWTLQTQSFTGAMLWLNLDQNGTVSVNSFFGTHGVLSQVVVNNTWNYVELGYQSAWGRNEGKAYLRVNNSEVAYLGELIGLGGLPFGAIKAISFHVPSSGWRIDVDDIAMSDRSWIGPGRVLARQGVGGYGSPLDTGAWTMTGGATIQEVWSQTPWNSASYATSTLTQPQTTPIAPVSSVRGVDTAVGPDDIVLAARILVVAMLETQPANNRGGPYSIRRRIGRSIVDTQILVNWHAFWIYQYSDIFTATPETLDTIQIGAIAGPAAPNLRIGEAWLMVLYAELEPNPLPLPTAQTALALAHVGAQNDAPAPTVEVLLRHKPVIYFRLGEDSGARTFRDSSGNARHGIVVGAQVYAGVDSYGALNNDPDTSAGFDPTYATGYIEIPYTPAFDLQQFTVSFWFMQHETANTARGFFHKTVNQGYASGYLIDQFMRQVRFYFQNANGEFFAARTLVDAQDLNIWRHYAFVVGNGKIRLYYEGQFITETPYTGTIPTGAGLVYIGRHSTIQGWGRLDEFALIPSMLSPEQVQEIFQSKDRVVAPRFRHAVLLRTPNNTIRKPRGWWRLNETTTVPHAFYSWAAIKDHSGNNLEIAAYGQPVVGVPGPVNETAMRFTNNIAQYVEGGPWFSWVFAQGEGTVIAFYRPNKPSANSGIFEKTIGGNVNTEFLLFQQVYGGRSIINWRLFYGSPVVSTDVGMFMDDRDVGKYMMIAATYSPTVMELYKNGVLANSLTATFTPRAHGDGSFYIGKLGNNIYACDGDIGEVMYFQVRLTAAEIKSIWDARYNRYASQDRYVGNDFYAGHILEPPQLSQDISGEDGGILEKGTVALALARGTYLRPGDRGSSLANLVGLKVPKNQGGSMELLSLVNNVPTTVWSGIIDKITLGDNIVVNGVSMPAGFLETEIPVTLVDEAWLTSMGITNRPGAPIDLGARIPDVYGNVPRVKAIYVREDLLANIYDYVVCRGSKIIPALYRNMPSSSTNGPRLSMINQSEWTGSWSIYPGFTTVRFTVRQVTGGDLHDIYADVTDAIQYEMAEPERMRNAARIIRTMLTDRAQPINAVKFNQAEADCAELGIFLDFAIQDAQTLQDILNGIMQIRDMVLSLTADGWGLSVDTRPQRIAYSFKAGPVDVDVPTIVQISAIEQLLDLQNAPSEIKIRCIPDLLAADENKRWLFTAKRPISNQPFASPLVIDVPYIRSAPLGDRMCDYMMRRFLARSEQTSIVAPYAAPSAIRQLVSITDLTKNLDRSVWIVVGIRNAVGGESEFTLKRWGPGPYMYEPGPLPTDVVLGTFEDYSRTNPPIIADITFPTGAPYQGLETMAGEIKAFVTVRFVIPAGQTNYSHALLRYRESGSPIWAPVGGPIYQSGTVEVLVRNLIPQTTYVFGVQSVNAWGLTAGS